LATSDSVEAISADLGYADARDFRRFFKRAPQARAWLSIVSGHSRLVRAIPDEAFQ
jgi:hypothetical protein